LGVAHPEIQTTFIERTVQAQDFNAKEGRRSKSTPFIYSGPGLGQLRDSLSVYLHIEDDQVKDASFEGSGCAIPKASSSMMTRAVKGKSQQEADTLFNEFHRMATGELDEGTSRTISAN
jgi:NifU-like protein involved in Fe-S cluster formation